VGIKEVHEDIWLVSFMDYDLGYFDQEKRVWNRFKIPSAQKCYLRSRYVVTGLSRVTLGGLASGCGMSRMKCREVL